MSRVARRLENLEQVVEEERRCAADGLRAFVQTFPPEYQHSFWRFAPVPDRPQRTHYRLCDGRLEADALDIARVEEIFDALPDELCLRLARLFGANSRRDRDGS
jgi:hypothetical protein